MSVSQFDREHCALHWNQPFQQDHQFPRTAAESPGRATHTSHQDRMWKAQLRSSNLFSNVQQFGTKKRTDLVCLHRLYSGGSAGPSHALAWDWASSVIVTRLHSALSGAVDSSEVERGREVAETQKSVRRNTWVCGPELNTASPTCFTSFQPPYWRKTYHTIHQTRPLSFSPDSGLKIDLTDAETVDEFHTPLALTCLHWNGIKPDLIQNLE